MSEKEMQRFRHYEALMKKSRKTEPDLCEKLHHRASGITIQEL